MILRVASLAEQHHPRVDVPAAHHAPVVPRHFRKFRRLRAEERVLSAVDDDVAVARARPLRRAFTTRAFNLGRDGVRRGSIGRPRRADEFAALRRVDAHHRLGTHGEFGDGVHPRGGARVDRLVIDGARKFRARRRRRARARRRRRVIRNGRRRVSSLARRFTSERRVAKRVRVRQHAHGLTHGRHLGHRRRGAREFGRATTTLFDVVVLAGSGFGARGVQFNLARRHRLGVCARR